MGMGRRLAVGFSSMGDAIDHHASGRVFNGIDDSITTHAEPISIGRAFELFCVRSAWIARERFDCVSDVKDRVTWEMAKLPSRGGRVENVIHGQPGSMRQQGVDFRHRDELVAPMGLEVGDVF